MKGFRVQGLGCLRVLKPPAAFPRCAGIESKVCFHQATKSGVQKLLFIHLAQYTLIGFC